MAGKARVVAYWIFTGIMAFEMTSGSLWDLLQIEFVKGVFDQLHYPHYLLLILGVWKLPCAFVVMLPRLLRLKEWAYAGAVFNFTGAAASHAFAGDGPSKWFGPALFTLFVLASWALRPPERKLAPSSSSSSPSSPSSPSLPSLRAWLVPAGVIVAFGVVALLTLPQGPPPP
jgi:hypothetical protein